MLNNLQKKGQVAETMTWVVATIIIFVILAIAIYAASVMSKANRTLDFNSNEPSILLKKSLQGYLFTEDEKGESVFVKLEKNEDFDSFSEELGKKIFKDPSGEFEISLELNSLLSFGRSYEEMKINENVNLEVVIKGGETTATI